MGAKEQAILLWTPIWTIQALVLNAMQSLKHRCAMPWCHLTASRTEQSSWIQEEGNEISSLGWWHRSTTAQAWSTETPRHVSENQGFMEMLLLQINAWLRLSGWGRTKYCVPFPLKQPNWGEGAPLPFAAKAQDDIQAWCKTAHL